MPRTLPITTLGMEILRKKTTPVKKIDAEFIKLIQDMFYTMDKATGVGLAAPQINVNKSVAVVDISYLDDYKDFKPMTLINPEIISGSGSTVEEEGCLSIPNVKAEVKRFEKIILKYMDYDLNEIQTEMKGFPARVVQHEIDHLNGILFIDHLSKEKLKELKKDLTLVRKGKMDIDYDILVNGK
ncbi:MAG TPA: peptide deformylase [Ignavibacteria bacterium]|nr:peptide deformylase [Ignavibacteria bacterium]HQY53150.1 peptide deformylase [Ignavibacteria bacterium]HRB01452.1 peptide deformylase [Ignavibacteria bacterium]